MSDLGFMGNIAESKIQEAIEEGKFDDLPGKGKPIVFIEDPLTPPHLRMMNRILANANVLPEWIQFQKDIEAERKQIDDMRSRLVRENTRWGVRLSKTPLQPGTAHQYSTWYAKQRTAYLQLLKSLNTLILKYTISAPSTAPHAASLNIEREIATFDSEVPAHIPLTTAAPAVPSENSPVRNAARSRYGTGDSRTMSNE